MEAVPQRLHRRPHPRLDGAERFAGLCGDLLLRQAAEIGEFNCLTLRAGQHRHRLRNDMRQHDLLARVGLRWLGKRATIADECAVRDLCLPLAAAEDIEGAAAGDGEEPGAECPPRAVEVLRVFPEPEKGVRRSPVMRKASE